MNTKYNIGGKVIGSGAYGCTFKPALRCKNSDTRYNGISKLLENKEANNEWDELMKAKNIIKNIPNFNKYFLLNNLEKCTPNKLIGDDLNNIENCKTPLQNINILDINTNLDKLKIINMQDGGITISDALKTDYRFLNKLNKLLINLLINAIVPMNALNLYHNDLKGDNLLYKNNEVKIIDWGLASINLSNNILNKSVAFNNPLSKVLFAPEVLNNYLQSAVFNNNQINKNNPDLFNQLYNSMKLYYSYFMYYLGQGHNEYLSIILDIIFKLANDNTINIQNLLEHIVASNCAKILMNYLNFETKTFDIDLFFNNVYSKNLDVYGLIMSYIQILFLPNMNNMKIRYANILIKYCFSIEYASKPIDINNLVQELYSLTDKNKLTNNTLINLHVLVNQNKVIKDNYPKSIMYRQKSNLFKKKKLVKKEHVKKEHVKKELVKKELVKKELIKQKKSTKKKVFKKKFTKKNELKHRKKYCPKGTRKKYYCESRTKLYKYKYKKHCPSGTKKMSYCRRIKK